MKFGCSVRAIQFRTWIVVWALLIVSISEGIAAEVSDQSIAILYPSTTSPTKAVYDDIRRGIDRRLHARGFRGVELALDKGQPAASELLEWSKSKKVAAAIALGRAALEQSQPLKRDLPVIAGALNLDSSSEVAGVSLTVNPRFLLGRLHELAPGIGRVLVVTSVDNDEPLLRAARSAARSIGLEIVEYQATDLREATQHFWNIFRYANPRHDAIWILNDSLVDAESTLPQILENAWLQRFLVVSNVVEHVRQGALIGTFLDGNGLGIRLADLATDAAVGKQVGQTLGEDVEYAINARVALHLGLQFNERIKARYGLVVGER